MRSLLLVSVVSFVLAATAASGACSSSSVPIIGQASSAPPAGLVVPGVTFGGACAGDVYVIASIGYAYCDDGVWTYSTEDPASDGYTIDSAIEAESGSDGSGGSSASSDSSSEGSGGSSAYGGSGSVSSSTSHRGQSSSGLSSAAPWIGSTTGPAAADIGDMCTPPAGASACTPGTVTCGGALTCDLITGDFCCEGAQSDSCFSTSAPASACPAMTSTSITCNEAADCPTGQVCCIATDNEINGTVSCQELVDGKCPTANLATAQICRSSGECPTGDQCQIWDCGGHDIEACENPVPSLPTVCTAK